MSVGKWNEKKDRRSNNRVSTFYNADSITEIQFVKTTYNGLVVRTVTRPEDYAPQTWGTLEKFGRWEEMSMEDGGKERKLDKRGIVLVLRVHIRGVDTGVVALQDGRGVVKNCQ